MPPLTVSRLLLELADDDRPGLRFEDRTWTWREHVSESRQWAGWLQQGNDGTRPFHVGVLLDNVPEFSFLLGAAALSGAVVVGLNPTRHGAELARDIDHTDCGVLITEEKYLDQLRATGVPFDDDRMVVVDRPESMAKVSAADPLTDPAPVDDADLFMLIFTSGTSGSPKAVRCTHRKVAGPGLNLAGRFELGHDDVCYLSMPLFHSNAIMAGWGPALAAGATMVLTRKFSASGFFPDIRRYGCTYANYVGKPLAYILATPERPEDADNPLRVAFGNEGGNRDIERFAQRFGCVVVDGFGSTEGGVTVGRVPGSPPNSLGVPGPGVSIRNPATMEPCPPAVFDDGGVLMNADEAIGELVNTAGSGAFEGYYRNDSADAERMRNGWYWSGDLAYADSDGNYFFAGRSLDWLRVDGENFGAAPVERLLLRHPDVTLAAVYAVPAPDVGDEVMAALLLHPGATFDPVAFADFLAAQPDLGTKWAPRFVRVTDALPQTATNKILKRVLAQERWRTTDDVWWRPERSASYVPFTTDALEAHEAEFERHGRTDVLHR